MNWKAIFIAAFSVIAVHPGVRAQVSVDFDGGSSRGPMGESAAVQYLFWRDVEPPAEPAAPATSPAYERSCPDGSVTARREFGLECDLVAADGDKEERFSPVSDLLRLRALITALPPYLRGTGTDFGVHRDISGELADAGRVLDAMLLKYSSGARSTTRSGFLVEAGPALKLLERVFFVIKSDHDGGSHSDNCWSDCVQACRPDDIGGIVCHLSCYYTCETLKVRKF